MDDTNIILIDPGHGGSDDGARYGYAEEDDTNLSIAFLLRCELEKEFYDVHLTRETDQYVSLPDRVLAANLLPADLFVSIHCDAYHIETAEGMSVHIHPAASERTWERADYLHRSLIDAFPDHLDRGIRHSDFYVLRQTRMAAVLIECEFLSNPKTRRFLKEPENQLALARAIAGGIG